MGALVRWSVKVFILIGCLFWGWEQGCSSCWSTTSPGTWPSPIAGLVAPINTICVQLLHQFFCPMLLQSTYQLWMLTLSYLLLYNRDAGFPRLDSFHENASSLVLGEGILHSWRMRTALYSWPPFLMPIGVPKYDFWDVSTVRLRSEKLAKGSSKIMYHY
jgi:hypothetical protein